MARLSLNKLFASPRAKYLWAILFCVAVMSVFYYVHLYKAEVRKEASRVLKKADRYGVTKDVQVFAPLRKYAPEETPDAPPEKSVSPAKTEETPQEKEETPSPEKDEKAPFTFSEKPKREAAITVPRAPAGRRPGGRVKSTAPVSRAEQILPICLYSKSSDASNVSVVPDGTDIAPYGRLLRCTLANTVSTSSLQTPVIALTTEPLWWGGVEIIPAGVEVHGTVSGSPSRDRIGTGTNWIVVYPFRDKRNGYQMQLTGIALDCNRSGTTWGKSDGSAGIRGLVKGNADQAKAMGYMATILAGAGSGLITETDNYIGNSTRTTTGGTWKDVIGNALAEGFKAIAKDKLDEASKALIYVEAEAGTEFYIYVQQVIDPASAARGKMVAGTGKLTETTDGMNLKNRMTRRGGNQ